MWLSDLIDVFLYPGPLSVVDCGPPPPVKDAILLSLTGTTYGSVAVFVCDEGFLCRGGGNSSLCNAEGLWTQPGMVCEGNNCSATCLRLCLWQTNEPHKAQSG